MRRKALNVVQAVIEARWGSLIPEARARLCHQCRYSGALGPDYPFYCERDRLPLTLAGEDCPCRQDRRGDDA